jgi:hypothetical protein
VRYDKSTTFHSYVVCNDFMNSKVHRLNILCQTFPLAWHILLHRFRHFSCDLSARMLTPHKHLFPPPVCLEVQVSNLFLLLVIPTCISRLMTALYLSHFRSLDVVLRHINNAVP